MGPRTCVFESAPGGLALGALAEGALAGWRWGGVWHVYPASTSRPGLPGFSGPATSTPPHGPAEAASAGGDEACASAIRHPSHSQVVHFIFSTQYYSSDLIYSSRMGARNSLQPSVCSRAYTKTELYSIGYVQLSYSSSKSFRMLIQSF